MPESSLPEPSGHKPGSKVATGLISPATRVNVALLCVGFLAFVLLWLAQSLTAVFSMLALALLLTYLLLGPVRFVETRLYRLLPKSRRMSAGLRRTLAVICVYVAFLGSCGLAVLQGAPTLSLQVEEFAREMPGYLTTLDSYITRLEQNFHPKIANGASKSESNRSASARSGRFSAEKLRDLSRKVAHVLLNIGAGTISGFVYILTSLVLAFYLLSDGTLLRNGLINLMPSDQEEGMGRFLLRTHMQLYNLVKAQALMSILSGGMIYLLLLILQVKFALLLGVFFGLASILPIIGPWLGLLPLMLILALGGHPLYISHVLLAAGLFHIIKAYWLWPKILHDRFNIHPVLFIITFLVGLNAVGWAGILLAFPFACLLGVALDMLKARHARTLPSRQ